MLFLLTGISHRRSTGFRIPRKMISLSFIARRIFYVALLNSRRRIIVPTISTMNSTILAIFVPFLRLPIKVATLATALSWSKWWLHCLVVARQVHYMVLRSSRYVHPEVSSSFYSLRYRLLPIQLAFLVRVRLQHSLNLKHLVVFHHFLFYY